MRPPLSPRRLPWLTGAAAAALYLSRPAARYNFDGVACAIAVDLGDLRHLAHGNHLAYGVLGWLWFSLWKLAGYRGPALYSLQALSSLLGAAAVGAFARLLLDIEVRPASAAAGALGLAVSEFYWTWSLEAQVYLLGALFLVLAAGEALRERPRPARLGALHAGAALGHVGHLMFAPAALYLLGRDARARRRYALCAAAVLATAYLAAAALCARPRSWDEARVWLLGSAALSRDRSFLWHGGYSAAALRSWLRTSARLWGGSAVGSVAALSLSAAGAAAAWRRERRVAVACLLWLAGYAALFLAWEPTTAVYRITDLVPLWILVVIGVESWSARAAWAPAALAALVAALGAWNFARVVSPAADPRRNAPLQGVLRVARETPDDAWVVASGIEQVYLPYFARRRPIDVRYYEGRAPDLEKRLAGLRTAGEPVFVMPRTLTDAWRAWFAARPLREVGAPGSGELYRLGAAPR